MKFRIHNGEYEDSIVIEGETFSELQKIAKRETEKRGWKDCWSEKIDEPNQLVVSKDIKGV